MELLNNIFNIIVHLIIIIAFETFFFFVVIEPITVRNVDNITSDEQLLNKIKEKINFSKDDSKKLVLFNKFLNHYQKYEKIIIKLNNKKVTNFVMTMEMILIIFLLAIVVQMKRLKSKVTFNFTKTFSALLVIGLVELYFTKQVIQKSIENKYEFVLEILQSYKKYILNLDEKDKEDINNYNSNLLNFNFVSNLVV